MRSFAFALPALFTGSFAYSEALQNILKNTEKSDKYTYPTDFTRDIVPKPFHSHNDYWRDVPFYEGISYGGISTEADVWLVNGTLYVRRLFNFPSLTSVLLVFLSKTWRCSNVLHEHLMLYTSRD